MIKTQIQNVAITFPTVSMYLMFLLTMYDCITRYIAAHATIGTKYFLNFLPPWTSNLRLFVFETFRGQIPEKQQTLRKNFIVGDICVKYMLKFVNVLMKLINFSVVIRSAHVGINQWYINNTRLGTSVESHYD